MKSTFPELLQAGPTARPPPPVWWQESRSTEEEERLLTKRCLERQWKNTWETLFEHEKGL